MTARKVKPRKKGLQRATAKKPQEGLRSERGHPLTTRLRRRGLASLFGGTAREENERRRSQREGEFDMMGAYKSHGYRYKRTGTTKIEGTLYHVFTRYDRNGNVVKRGMLRMAKAGWSAGARGGWWDLK